jgi:hypothetical protein
MNAKKLWRKIAREHFLGESIGPSDAPRVRWLIGHGLVNFMHAVAQPLRLVVSSEQFDKDPALRARLVSYGDTVIVKDVASDAEMTILQDLAP